MPAHLPSERTIPHVPVLTPTVEEASSGFDTIHEEDVLSASSPSTTSTVRPPRRAFVHQDNTKLLPKPASQYGATIHFHAESTSTSASESAGSSPTTAPSLTESFHNSDTPTTSPDTPASNQFSSTSSPTFTLASRVTNFELRDPPTGPQPAPRDLPLPRPSTGLKGKRNLKNLAVDTSSATAFGKAISTASLPLNRAETDGSMLAGAPTPALVQQPKFLRSKRSALGLTLVTPSSSGSAKSEDAQIVPPTPSLVRPQALRHFPSSPSLLVRSPNYTAQQTPLNGLERLNSSVLPGNEVPVGFHPHATPEEDEEEMNFDVPQSQEPKVETYPDGPICIYDPHVYLYYEPSAEQASQFDTIVNVAQEVPNPFKPKTEDQDKAETPKASTPLYKEPEYVHIPWQHNTDIVPDLADLCVLVDERVKQGKKVLIHCQCGVSRSASLIVAYGLFKNPSMAVQEAYDAVKRRSKWINPNMSLIMQLQEFRSQQLKSSAGMPARTLRLKSPGQLSVRTPLEAGTTRHANSKSEDDSKNGPKSAPLDSAKHKSSKSNGSAAEFVTLSPGPSSAPSGYPWPSDSDDLSDKDTGSSYATPLETPGDGLESPATVKKLPPATPQTQAPSDTLPRQMSPPRIEKRPAPLKLPATHLSRFQATNASIVADSPRSTEFTIAPARVPVREDMLGLTSPREAPAVGPTASPAPSFVASGVPAVKAKPAQPALAPITEPSSTSLSFSPRGEEFGMSGIQSFAASLDDTFGLTSPRGEAFSASQPLQNTLSVATSNTPQAQDLPSNPPPAPPARPAPPPPTGGIFSPRSEEFAMSAVKSPQEDDTFGLTSPRNSMFPAQLPLQPSHNTARSTAMSALHPEVSENQPNQQNAGDRAKLRSKLGMSTSSSYDMRSEYILAAKARELRPTLSPQNSFQRQLRAQDDMSEALMSPRATEFTSNPFRDAFNISVPGGAPLKSSQMATVETVTPKKADPRSPPQKGASPITRNIFDVIS